MLCYCRPSGSWVGGSIQLAHVAAAEHHVVGDHRRLQASRHVLDIVPPFPLTHPRQSAHPEVIFKGPSLAIGQMGQFQGPDHVLDDQGGAESGAQAEIKHPSAFVTTQGLHGGIVDDLGGPPKVAFEVVANPAAPEIEGLRQRFAPHDRAGVADRHVIVLPPLGSCLDAVDHLRWGHLRPRREFAHFLLASGQDLDIGATDVDDQDSHAVISGSSGYQ